MPPGRTALRLLFAIFAFVPASAPAQSAPLPEIRMHAANRVPACVTPDQLMQFLGERNPNLDHRLQSIASLYKQHGEALGVRWDYAFFQMLHETNFLTYRAAPGRWGDVRPRQNNFAGLGTVGGGVAGDSFPDVSTGVLAQIQHLLAYSGQHVDSPAARRTREQQDDIIARSRALGRPVTFNDLTRRWATNRRYAAMIESIAQRYRSAFCTGRVLVRAEDAHRNGGASRAEGARGTPERMTMADASAGLKLLRSPAPARRPQACRVWTASYGGDKSILIRASVGDEIHYTALQVLDGFQTSLSTSFIEAHAPSGQPVAQFESRDGALARAFDLCPAARQRTQ
jgi:hypothetical protein